MDVSAIFNSCDDSSLVGRTMTHSPGDSFRRQRCNQCRARVADYCKAADEYLCELCEEYALTQIAVDEALGSNIFHPQCNE